MRLNIIYILLVMLCTFNTMAQQSLFNVPSISITREQEAFFQEQVNATTDGTFLNFNAAYGVAHDFELGINIVGVGVGYNKGTPVLLVNESTKEEVPYSPLVMLTSLKAFPIGEHVNIGVGAQVGLNPLQNRKINTGDIATFDYLNVRLDVPHTHLMLCGGGYYSNLVYLGQKSQFGPMFGFEYVIIEHKFLLMGDWLIGKNAVSVAVPGIVFHPHHNVALSAGWQIPSPGSQNPQGFVFELTLGNFSSK